MILPRRSLNLALNQANQMLTDFADDNRLKGIREILSQAVASMDEAMTRLATVEKQLKNLPEE